VLRPFGHRSPAPPAWATSGRARAKEEARLRTRARGRGARGTRIPWNSVIGSFREGVSIFLTFLYLGLSDTGPAASCLSHRLQGKGKGRSKAWVKGQGTGAGGDRSLGTPTQAILEGCSIFRAFCI